MPTNSYFFSLRILTVHKDVCLILNDVSADSPEKKMYRQERFSSACFLHPHLTMKRMFVRHSVCSNSRSVATHEHLQALDAVTAAGTSN